MANSIIKYEAGQTAKPFEEMTDGGDLTVFSASFFPISNAAGFEPVIAPYGLLTGGAITVDTGTNDSVSVAALTVLAPGMTGATAAGVVSVSAGDVEISRGATTNTHRITSITVASDGTLAAVAGTAHTAFSETRGATGGPPLIPVGSVELGQVRVTSTTAAEVTSGEIYTVPGLHTEMSSSPGYSVNYATGEVTFNDALPAIHTGEVGKKVYISGATPVFASFQYTSDWTGADPSYSTNSTETYDGPIATSSSSIGNASFTVNNITEDMEPTIRGMDGNTIWIEFRRDRNKTSNKYLTQGVFGATFTYPTGGGNPSAACTITPSSKTVLVAS